MSSRPLVILGVLLILGGIVAGSGYLLKQHRAGAIIPPDSSISTGTNPAASSTNDMTGSQNAAATSTSLVIPSAASSTIDTTSWPLYVDSQNRFSIEYPSNFIQNVGAQNDPTAPYFVPPTNVYFHWPLQDDVKITATVTASCPPLASGHPTGKPVATQVTANNISFKQFIDTDVAAGNRYLEVVYDTLKNGQCYRIDLLDHGANGAGLYVDDPSLIKNYDAQHDADLAAVLKLYVAMVSSFRILGNNAQ